MFNVFLTVMLFASFIFTWGALGTLLDHLKKIEKSLSICDENDNKIITRLVDIWYKLKDVQSEDLESKTNIANHLDAIQGTILSMKNGIKDISAIEDSDHDPAVKKKRNKKKKDISTEVE